MASWQELSAISGAIPKPSTSDIKRFPNDLCEYLVFLCLKSGSWPLEALKGTPGSTPGSENGLCAKHAAVQTNVIARPANLPTYMGVSPSWEHLLQKQT